MKQQPIIIFSGTDFEYHICDSMSDFLESAYNECKKFINAGTTYDSRTETKFANIEETAKFLLADCLLKEDFGDICSFVKMRQNFPCDGTFTDDLFD